MSCGGDLEKKRICLHVELSDSYSLARVIMRACGGDTNFDRGTKAGGDIHAVSYVHLHTSTTSINTDYKLRCHEYKNLKGAFKNTDTVLYKGLSLHDFLVFSIFVSLSCFRSLQTCWYETKMGCVSLSQTLSAECPPHISRCFAIFK